MRRLSFAIICLESLIWTACSSPDAKNSNSLFVDRAAESGITFSNDLEYTEELNPYTFRTFYNGGGVGIGDINNDSLPDIFFAGNLVSNKLYLNTGAFTFRDITVEAGVGSDRVWTTGVSLVDINADGWLDIYICKSGPPGGGKRKNELYVNKHDLTFSEEAASYGLDFEGLSVHAAFFDYDRDGDLDCYLLNNSMRAVGVFDLRKDQRKIPDPDGGNKLLRNDGGHYVDVSQEAGIYTSKIGFGLGVTVSDLNEDGWPDLYVSNDFFEKDYLYINNKNGTFTECLEDRLREISLGSMGADIADINNDGLPEIFVTEMLPEHDYRLKTTSQFENWDKYQSNVAQGYHRQFSRNSLQLNNGNGTFSEISRYSGTAATDWSWGALIFDMDSDGFKDIFVANGIFKDLINQDYINFIANPETVRRILQKEQQVIKRLVDSIPSNKIPDYAFRNKGDLTFADSSAAWGLGAPNHSNGSAYGDLDNDGDLDLVLNNVNMPASVFENRSNQVYSKNKTLTLNLKGEGANTIAIGAMVVIKDDGKVWMQELNPMRGFMSTVDSRLVFGLGDVNEADTVVVRWPDGRQTELTRVLTGQTLTLEQSQAAQAVGARESTGSNVFRESAVKGLDFVHRENDYTDFDRDRLLFNMITNEGPCLCKGDVNGDGRDDIYVGGARGQAGGLFVQNANGTFSGKKQPAFEADLDSEDTDCEFFDADGDGDPDLYVTSGSNEYSSSSSLLLDRLYLNNNGNFSRSQQSLPVSTSFECTSTVSVADFEGDGDNDLFVGTRVIPFYYGVPPSSYLLLNDGKGLFSNATVEHAPGLDKIGMVTDSRWTDVNSDDRPDLVVVGEWMPVKVFIQRDSKLVDESEGLGLAQSNGWYQALAFGDFNKDGLTDFVTGNHGLNSRFKASRDEPVTMYVSDFDENGTIEHITTRYDLGQAYPFNLRHDLVAQIPSLKKKYLHFRSYADQGITDIFGAEKVKAAVVLNAYDFESALWLAKSGGGFERKPLPREAQFAPVYDILSEDFDGDGDTDLLLGGNLHRAKPETGIYDGSYGLMLVNDGAGSFTALSPERSGISLRGEVRSMTTITVGRKRIVLVARNNLGLVSLEY